MKKKPQNLGRAYLVGKLMARGLSRRQSVLVVNVILERMIHALRSGWEVEFPFGKLKRVRRHFSEEWDYIDDWPAHRQHDIRFSAFIVGGKHPCGRAAGAMFESFLHVQPLKLRLLSAGDDIHVIAAAHAMVEDAQQTVGIWWIIHANYFTAARQSIVYVSGCLMAEAIVIVAPRVACEQNIERRERSAPRIVQALLKPFGMLGGHRINHLSEGFV